MKYFALLLITAAMAFNLYTDLHRSPISTGWVTFDLVMLWACIILILVPVWSKVSWPRPPMNSN